MIHYNHHWKDINRSLVRFRFARTMYLLHFIFHILLYIPGHLLPLWQQAPTSFIQTDTLMQFHQKNLAFCPCISKNTKPYRLQVCEFRVCKCPNAQMRKCVGILFALLAHPRSLVSPPPWTHTIVRMRHLYWNV